MPLFTLALLAAAPASYRASGTEPFWSLTITGSTARLEQVGLPTMQVRGLMRHSSASAEQYRSTQVSVDVRHVACSDGMSDARYPDTVTVTWQKRTLVGCGGTPAGAGSAAAKREGTWRIAAIDGGAVTLSAAVLVLTDDAITGSAGCNRIRGHYAVTGDMLTAAPPAVTRMMCAPTATQVERRMLAVLAQPARLTWAGTDRMTLSNGVGTLALARR